MHRDIGRVSETHEVRCVQIRGDGGMEEGHAFEKQDWEVLGEEVTCRWRGFGEGVLVQHKERECMVVFREYLDERRPIGGGPPRRRTHDV